MSCKTVLLLGAIMLHSSMPALQDAFCCQCMPQVSHCMQHVPATERAGACASPQTRQLHKDNAQLKARAEELEAANRALAAEAYRWQRRYEDLYGQAAAAGQAPPADAPPAASLEHGPYFAPTPDRRVKTLLGCFLLQCMFCA